MAFLSVWGDAGGDIPDGMISFSKDFPDVLSTRLVVGRKYKGDAADFWISS